MFMFMLSIMRLIPPSTILHVGKYVRFNIFDNVLIEDTYIHETRKDTAEHCDAIPYHGKERHAL